jgi:hypothetical protein
MSVRPAPLHLMVWRAGFRIGQRYELAYIREFDEVRVPLPHGSPRAGPMVLTAREFEKWVI